MTKSARQVMWEAETERDFQAKVINWAQELKWYATHFRPARTARTYIGMDGEEHEIWVTPIQGDPGFPDTILVRENKDGTASLIIWELKSEQGKLSVVEAEWLRVLAKVPGIISGVKRPSDWDEIQAILEQ